MDSEVVTQLECEGRFSTTRIAKKHCTVHPGKEYISIKQFPFLLSLFSRENFRVNVEVIDRYLSHCVEIWWSNVPMTSANLLTVLFFECEDSLNIYRR